MQTHLHPGQNTPPPAWRTSTAASSESTKQGVDTPPPETAARRAPVITDRSSGLQPPSWAAPVGTVPAARPTPLKRAQRSTEADQPKVNAAVSALRAEYPFIEQSASAYVDAMLPSLGMGHADKDQTMLVRFNKPTAEEKAHIRANGKLRIAEVDDIAGKRSLGDVLIHGFGQYDRAGMGAARGEFGVYTQAQLAQGLPLATGDARALAAYRASHPGAAGSGEIVPSQIGSARLYNNIERAWASGQTFQQAYQKQLQQYWGQHQAPLAEQQKRIALDMTNEANVSDALDSRDVDLAVHGFSGDPRYDIKVYPLDLAGQRSHNALRIEDSASGRNLLYLPGNRTPLRSFDNVQAARDWIDQKAAKSGWVHRFVQRHFTLSATPDELSRQLQQRARAAGRETGGQQDTPLLTSDNPLGAEPFQALTKWQMQQDVENMNAAIGDSVKFAAAQKAQRTAWRVLEGAQAAQQSGLAGFVAPPLVAADVTDAEPLPKLATVESRLEQIASQQPDLQSSAAQYASRYLQQHFGIDLDAENTYLAGFVPPLPNLGNLPPNLGGMPASNLLPNALADASSMPMLPPEQVRRRTRIDELFIRNFDHADGKLGNRKGATAFGVFTAADFQKKHMTVDTWQQIDEKARADGTSYGMHNPYLAASRIDAKSLYQQMMRPAAEGGNDFAKVYHKQVEDFWDTHGSALTGLHREAAMARLDEEMEAGRLSEGEHAFFRKGLENVKGSSVQVHPLNLGGRVSSSGLRLLDANGDRTGLYLPGEPEAFKTFANRGALETWFNQRAKDGAWVDRFAGTHFSANDANGLDGDTGVVEFLKKDLQQGYATYSGRQYPKALSPTRRIEGDPFDYLSQTMKKKDLEDAGLLVNSNRDYHNKEVVRDFKDVPLAGGIVQMVLGRGSERKRGAEQVLDDVVNTALVVVPEVKPALEGVQAASAIGRLAEEGGEAASGAAASGATAGERGLPQRVSQERERPPVDYRVQPAIDHGVSLEGHTADANQVYAIGNQQYIDLDGHAARIQALTDGGRRAILVNESGHALHGAQVWRGDSGRWQVASLKGGAPGWPKLGSKAGKQPVAQGTGNGVDEQLSSFWNRLPTGASAGIHPSMITMPSALYDAGLSTEEVGAFVRNELTKPGNGAIQSSVARKVAASESKLLSDTNAFAQQSHPPRSRFVAPAAQAADADILSSTYQQSSGLILGETHSEAAPIRFLTENMAALRRNGVRTLYVELADDLVGPDLEAFNRGEKMSDNLTDLLDQVVVPRTDPRYSLKQVLQEARTHGIEVRGVDTLAADQFSATSANRTSTMNYYAYKTIQADQKAKSGKWVALVGAGHSNNVDPGGFPGLGQLLGVPSLRLKDVPVGTARSFGIDTGLRVRTPSGASAWVSNDWLLSLPRKP